MKKLLAILLSAIMVFSLGLTAFAEGEEGNTGILLPDFPVQTENEIYFANENINIEAGGTYEIPVYIISNYTPSTEGYVLLGINFALVGAAYDSGFVSITGIRPSDEVKALAGYELIACDVALGGDPENDIPGDPAYNMFGFKADDLSIFNQEKMPIAYVTVAVTEAYTGYDADGNAIDCQLDIGMPHWYFYDNEYLMYASYCQLEIFNPDTFEGEQFWGDSEGLYIVSGHLTVAPPVPTWEERLTAWAIEQATKILTFFQGLNEVLLGLLASL